MIEVLGLQARRAIAALEMRSCLETHLEFPVPELGALDLGLQMMTKV
jgi:hypothetical protein